MATVYSVFQLRQTIIARSFQYEISISTSPITKIPGVPNCYTRITDGIYSPIFFLCFHVNFWVSIAKEWDWCLHALGTQSILDASVTDIFVHVGLKKYWNTRMHSSGMRTARLLTVSQHALDRWGVCQGGVPGPGGCVSVGVYLPRGGGVYPSMQWGRHPPVDRQTPVKA